MPYTLSWGSENHVNQMARLTDFELDVKEPQWMRRSFHPARRQKIHNMEYLARHYKVITSLQKTRGADPVLV